MCSLDLTPGRPSSGQDLLIFLISVEISGGDHVTKKSHASSLNVVAGDKPIPTWEDDGTH